MHMSADARLFKTLLVTLLSVNGPLQNQLNLVEN